MQQGDQNHGKRGRGGVEMKWIFLFVSLLAPSIFSETPDEMRASLDKGLRDWVDESCPKSYGPYLWSNCIKREVEAIRGGVPAYIDSLSIDEKRWVKESCPSSNGPYLTILCYEREVGALEAGLPSIEGLSHDQLVWLDESCQKSNGPYLYSYCLEREIPALRQVNAGEYSQNTEVQIPDSTASTSAYGGGFTPYHGCSESGSCYGDLIK